MQDLGRVVGHHPGVALTEKRARFVADVAWALSDHRHLRQPAPPAHPWVRRRRRRRRLRRELFAGLVNAVSGS